MHSTKVLICIFTAVSYTIFTHASNPPILPLNALVNEQAFVPAASVAYQILNGQTISAAFSAVEHGENESPASLASKHSQQIYTKLGVPWVDPEQTARQAAQADALRQQLYKSNINKARCLLGMGLGTTFVAGLSNKEKAIIRLFTLSTAFIINAAHFISFYHNINDLIQREREGTFFSRLETFCYNLYPFFMAQSYFQGVIISNKSHIIDSVNHYLKDVL